MHITESTPKELLVGKKFICKRDTKSFKQGEVVEVIRIDVDGDIVVEGERDFHYYPLMVIFVRNFALYTPELDTKWIVWNMIGSDTATSEEEAKEKAEVLLGAGVDGPVYIAKAQAKADINKIVWTN